MSGPLDYSRSYYGHPPRSLPQFVPAPKRTIGAIAQPGPEPKHFKIDPRHQAVKPDPYQKLEKRLMAIESTLGFDGQSSNNIQKIKETLQAIESTLGFDGQSSNNIQKIKETLQAIESALGFDGRSSNNLQKIEQAVQEACSNTASMYVNNFPLVHTLQANTSTVVSSYSRSQTKTQITPSLCWHPNQVQQQNPIFSTSASFPSLIMNFHEFTVSFATSLIEYAGPSLLVD